MTKPAVWVQFAVKKNRVDDKNLLHLKYTTSQKLWVFFSVLIKISFHKLFCPVTILNWYAARLNLVHIMTEVMIWNRRTLKIWKLICKAPNSDESGTKCWPAGLVYLKSAAILSIINYSLKDIPMNALEVKYNTGWSGWIQS